MGGIVEDVRCKVGSSDAVHERCVYGCGALFHLEVRFDSQAKSREDGVSIGCDGDV